MYKNHANAALRRESPLLPDFRTLGTFRPKGFAKIAISVKVRLDETNLCLYYDRNGSLSEMSNLDDRMKIEDTLGLLEQQCLADALTTHRKVGKIHIENSAVFSAVVYRGKTTDLSRFGIVMSPITRDMVLKQLAEWDHPTESIILGKNQISKA